MNSFCWIIWSDDMYTQQTHNVLSTSLQHSCNVLTLQRRCNDVGATLCCCWVWRIRWPGPELFCTNCDSKYFIRATVHSNSNPLRASQPASVAQLDAPPTGDQEVAGLTLQGRATFFRGDWSWNTFYGHSLLFVDSRRAVDSFWRKNVHNTG